MASKTCVFIFMLFVAIQTSLLKASAVRQRSDMDGLMADEKQRRTRQNEIRNAYNEYVSDMGKVQGQGWPDYNVDAVPWPAEETVPDRIVFYANMIRNDANLLDNSVPNRIPKTGNVKVKKEDHTIPDDHCKCEKRIETVDLTKAMGVVYPYTARNVTCGDNCFKPFTCAPKIYNMTVLKRRPQALSLDFVEMDKLNRGYEMPLPRDLVRNWTPATIPVTTGCYCTLP